MIARVLHASGSLDGFKLRPAVRKTPPPPRRPGKCMQGLLRQAVLKTASPPRMRVSILPMDTLLLHSPQFNN
jgi:hypothetical protein